MSFESENKNVEKIVVSNKTYYLVGTSHISENSVKLVKEVIKRVQPDTVSIELDKKRYEKYTNSNQWGNTDIIKIIKEKNRFKKMVEGNKTFHYSYVDRLRQDVRYYVNQCESAVKARESMEILEFIYSLFSDKELPAWYTKA
ncbi:TPA: hypothetical protein IUX07_003393, partial [Enterococcus faecalis]|nr:hypothetical protein [Enterococcus faecalis]